MYYTQDNIDLYIHEKDKKMLHTLWEEDRIIPLLQLAPKVKPQWNKLISLLAIYVFLRISQMTNEDFISNFEIDKKNLNEIVLNTICLLYTSPSPRDLSTSRMPSSA